MTFVDTSALYAVLDRSDECHAAAKEWWLEMLEGDEPLLVSSYVLVETTALLQNRLGMAAVRALSEEVLPVFSIHWISKAEHFRAMHALLSANPRALSLVDCSSFHVMRQRRIRTAFAFDPHFAEEGFDLVPVRRG